MGLKAIFRYFDLWYWCNMVLLIIAVVSALMVVYTKYLTRNVTASIHSESNQQEKLDIEWSQLLLEESALGGQQRVETLAKKKLKMKQIQSKDVVVIKP